LFVFILQSFSIYTKITEYLKAKMAILQENLTLAIGLMSGTSLDGVDAALVMSDGIEVAPWGRAIFLPYNKDDQELFKTALSEAAELGTITQNNEIIEEAASRLTALHIEAVIIILAKNNLTPEDVTVVGFHGQTILHLPDEAVTWQIGHGDMLAKAVNIPVINDFRSFDVRNGGEGAPLVPIYHLGLMRSQEKMTYPAAILNIGGVGNVTYLGSKNQDDLKAFDTGPGNALLDDHIFKYGKGIMDEGGRYCASGTVNHALLNYWLSHPFFELKPPKSLDRNFFELTGIEDLSFEDGAATIAAFTCQAVKMAENLCPENPAAWYVTGGGRHNKFIMDLLTELLEGDVKKVEELGWCGDSLEAEAFAYMALRLLKGLPISFPMTTGIDEKAYEHKKGQTGKYYPV
jgi:anhydro-N-acetylmuramic acid kinase